MAHSPNLSLQLESISLEYQASREGADSQTKTVLSRIIRWEVARAMGK